MAYKGGCMLCSYIQVLLGESLAHFACQPASPNRPAALSSSPPPPLPLLNLSGEASGHLWLRR